MKKTAISIVCIILVISILAVCYVYAESQSIASLIENSVDEIIDNGTTDTQKIINSLNITQDNYQQMAEYVSSLIMLSEDESVSEILNNLVIGGYDAGDVIAVYKFCRGTDCSIDTVKKVLDLKDEFTGLHWIENAYNYITDDKYGVLDYDQVCEYLNNGYTTEDIVAANMLCRKGKYTINDILNKYGNGETWTSLYNEIEDVSFSFFSRAVERTASDVIEMLDLKNDYGIDEQIISALNTGSEIIEFRRAIDEKQQELSDTVLNTIISENEVLDNEM